MNKAFSRFAKATITQKRAYYALEAQLNSHPILGNLGKVTVTRIRHRKNHLVLETKRAQ